MLNSANYTSQTGVIVSGEQIASEISPQMLKDPNTKIYYHVVAGAKTILPDGAEIVFVGGMFATQNPDIISYMEKVANKRGTMIYTRNKSIMTKDADVAAEDAKHRAAESNVLGNGAVLNIPKAG